MTMDLAQAVLNGAAVTSQCVRKWAVASAWVWRREARFSLQVNASNSRKPAEHEPAHAWAQVIYTGDAESVRAPVRGAEICVQMCRKSRRETAHLWLPLVHVSLRTRGGDTTDIARVLCHLAGDT